MGDIEEMGGDSKFTLIRMPGTIDASNEDTSSSSEEVPRSEKRTGWDNKIQYILAQIGFAVGLGNVWRFPYLCQKNGGGAFLIPYTIMLILEGVPLFYLEIAIGQRKRRGSVGVWNLIHPYLGGVGIASMVVCFLIAVYYNMIIAWALFYFFNSFQAVLPWSACPNQTVITSAPQLGADVAAVNMTSFIPVEECSMTSSTSYFWYRNTLDISPDIEQSGGVVWRMLLVLAAAWLIVFIGTFKGIKSSGKIIYFSATFPYVVLIAYFFRGITLPGAVDGLAYMFTPDISRLADPNVWRDAATQIFFSLGLGFGGVIAYSSYNDVKNNCRRDALFVSIVNCATSMFASVVIFCILGFKAHHRSEQCVTTNMEHLNEFTARMNAAMVLVEQNSTLEQFPNATENNFSKLFHAVNSTIHKLNSTSSGAEFPELMKQWDAMGMYDCSIEWELKEAVSGPGLAFIAFTEAMIKMPGGPFWSILFFAMLINLGLGSMFGTLEGIITPLRDLGLSIRKELVVALLCFFSFGVGTMFTLRSGMYLLDIFDTYAGTVPLLLIAFFETIAVVYVYGYNKFAEDLSYMIGDSGPGLYWKLTWKFLSPCCMFVLFVTSVLKLFLETPTYKSYDATTGNSDVKLKYPPWAQAMIIFLILLSIIWIPVIALLRRIGVLKYLPVESQPKQPEREGNELF